MNSFHTSARASTVPVLLYCLVALGFAVLPLPAGAQICYTCATEWTQIMNNFELVTQYAKQIEQYKQQVEQYQTQLKQYEQMYIKGDAYTARPGFREEIEKQFPARDINAGVSEGCGEAKQNPVGTEQRNYCVAIVQTRNRRYNAMRALLQDVASNDKDLEAASSERAAIKSEDQGALQANTNKITAINTKMQNDVQNAKYTMDAYNAVLTTLNEDMVRAANTALKNQNGLLGSVVEGLLLKGALDAARHRDR